jgi:hypothetical protein
MNLTLTRDWNPIAEQNQRRNPGVRLLIIDHKDYSLRCILLFRKLKRPTRLIKQFFLPSECQMFSLMKRSPGIGANMFLNTKQMAYRTYRKEEISGLKFL